MAKATGRPFREEKSRSRLGGWRGTEIEGRRELMVSADRARARKRQGVSLDERVIGRL